MLKFLRNLIIMLCVCSCIFLYACYNTDDDDLTNNNGGNQTEQDGGDNQNNNNENNNNNNNNENNNNNNNNENNNNNNNNDDNNNNNDDENNNNENVNQGGNDTEQIPQMTLEEKLNAYSILVELSQNIYDLKEDNQTTTKYSEYYGYSVDISESGLTQEEWDNYHVQAGINIIPISTTIEKTTVSGRNTKGEGYKNHTIYYPNYDSTVEELSEVLKYNETNDEYILYFLKSKFGSYTYWVDDNYANNVYTYDFHNENYGVTELLEIFAKTQDYSLLNTLVVDYINETMTIGKENVTILWNNYTTTIDIEKQDDNYVMTVKLVYTENSISNPSYPTEVYGEYKFKFNENKILSVDISNGFNMLTEETSYFMLQYYFDQTELEKEFTEENNLKFYVNKYYEVSIDFNQEFDSTKLEQDTSNCPGQLYKTYNSYENQIIYVDLGITNTAFVKFGDTISVSKYQNCDYTLYWDKFCLKPIQEGETYASYHRPIYAKVTPREGYALVKFLHRDSYGYSLEQAGSFRIGAIEYDLSNNPVYPIEPAPLMDKVIKVVVDGVEVVDFENGISLTESKIYYIDIYSAYSWQS